MPGESGGLQVVGVLADRNPAAAGSGAEPGAKVFRGDDEPVSTARSCSRRTSAGHPLQLGEPASQHLCDLAAALGPKRGL